MIYYCKYSADTDKFGIDTILRSIINFILMKQKFSNFEIETPIGVKIYNPRSTKEETEALMRRYMGTASAEDIEVYKEAEVNGNIFRDEDGCVVMIGENGTYQSDRVDILKDDSFNEDHSIWGHTKGRRGAKQKAMQNTLYKILSTIKSNTPLKAVVTRHDAENKRVFIDIPQFELRNVMLYRPMFDYRDNMLDMYPIGHSLYVFAENDDTGIKISDRSFIPDIFTSMPPHTKATFTVFKTGSHGCICEAEYDGIKCRAYASDIDNTMRVGDVFVAPVAFNKSGLTAALDDDLWTAYAKIVEIQPKRKLTVYATATRGYKVYETIEMGNETKRITLFVPRRVVEGRTDIEVGTVLKLEIVEVRPENELVIFKI